MKLLKKGELLAIAFALCTGGTSIKRANSFVFGK
jgi:hypothetical protein